MITENGLLFENQSSRLRIKPKKDSLKIVFWLFKIKNDTLRHSIPYCYLLGILLFLISLVKRQWQ
jgi:hypothetical protein